MKKLILSILLIFLSATPAYSWMSMMQVAGSGGAAAFTCSGDTALACDNYDGGSVECVDDGSDPAQTNCWATYTVRSCAGGTITNVGTGLESGSNYGKTLTAASGNYCASYVTTTALGGAFVRLNIANISAGSAPDGTSVVAVRSSADAGLCNLGVNNGKWVVYSNGAWNAAESTGPSAGTTYYVWIDYTKNSATGCKITVATTGTKGTAFGAPGYQTANTDAVRTQMYAQRYDTTGRSDPVTFDRLRVGTTAFGNDTP